MLWHVSAPRHSVTPPANDRSCGPRATCVPLTRCPRIVTHTLRPSSSWALSCPSGRTASTPSRPSRSRLAKNGSLGCACDCTDHGSALWAVQQPQQLCLATQACGPHSLLGAVRGMPVDTTQLTGTNSSNVGDRVQTRSRENAAPPAHRRTPRRPAVPPWPSSTSPRTPPRRTPSTASLTPCRPAVDQQQTAMVLHLHGHIARRRRVTALMCIRDGRQGKPYRCSFPPWPLNDLCADIRNALFGPCALTP